jgi:hypothetical protein
MPELCQFLNITPSTPAYIIAAEIASSKIKGVNTPQAWKKRERENATAISEIQKTIYSMQDLYKQAQKDGIKIMIQLGQIQRDRLTEEEVI